MRILPFRPCPFRGFAAIAVLLLLAAHADADATLRWKLKEGDTLSYAMDQKTLQKMTINNMQAETTATQTMDMTWHVRSVDDQGNAKISQTIDRIQFKMDVPLAGGSVEYDSKNAKPPEGPLGQFIGPVFDAMVGGETVFTIDPLGEVSSVKLPEKLVNTLKNNPLLASLGGSGGMFSEEGLKQMVGQSVVSFPEDSVSAGDSWDRMTEMKTPGGLMTVTTTYSYEAPEKQDGASLEKIAVKTRMTIEPAEGAAAQVKIIAQDSDGTVYFDNRSGRMNEFSGKQKMTLDTTVGNMSFKQQVETTATMKLGRPTSAGNK